LERNVFLRWQLTYSGTFGAVHKAVKVNTDRIFAVKIIRSLHGSNISQDLEREIRIMKKLDHVHSTSQSCWQ
jgi:serine/threonine protein kinase